MAETHLLGGKIILRPDAAGNFDELMLMEGNEPRVHMEVLDDNCLWIEIWPKGEDARRVCVWVNSNSKLRIRTEED